jgi:hypothetical protein
MAMQDVSITVSDPDQDYLVQEDPMDVELVHNEDDEVIYSFGVPKIKVLKKYQDWCVLLLSRGTGPRALLQWVSENENKCFDFPELVYSSGSEVDGEEPSGKHERTREINPVLVNPHYSAYAQSLVLVARTPCFLKFLVHLRITVHCLVKGRHKPGTEIQLKSIVEGKECNTRA